MMRSAFLGFTAGCTLGLLAIVGVKVAPSVQWALAPITGEVDIPTASVVRLDDGRLCWTRITQKLRLAEPWNFDVMLDRPWSGDRTFPEVHDRVSKQTWHVKGALPVGRHAQNQCIAMPPLAPGEPVSVTQTVHYPGWFGWWDLSVPLPTIAYMAPS